MKEPLNGAIIPALDPNDFVCLILEDIAAAAAGWHSERLTSGSKLGLGPNLPD